MNENKNRLDAGQEETYAPNYLKSIAPLLIGFILSPLFEKNFRRALILSNGNWGVFFSSPLCWIFWIVTALSVFYILRSKRKDKNLADGL